MGPLHGTRNGLCTCGNQQCDRPGAHLRVKLKDARSEPAIVTEYWTRWPAARIAIETGIGGLIAVKVSGETDRAVLDGWLTRPTVEFKQGSDTIYFFAVDDDEMPVGEIRLDRGVTVLGRNQFVPVPDDLPENKVVAAPDALLDRLCARKPSVDTSRLSTGQGPVTGGDLVVTRASDIKSKAVSWLWPNRIARGCATLIAGEMGLGKSQLAAWLAATVSIGGGWPQSEGSAPLGDVVMLISEDDRANTIKPRLTAAKADARRIHLVGFPSDADARPFNLLDRALDRLDKVIKSMNNPKLLVVDPIGAFFGNHINDPIRARQLLNRLDGLAKRHDLAVVLIGHLTKSNNRSALHSIGGAFAIGAAARAVYLVVNDGPGSIYRLFVSAKNNLAADRSALKFFTMEEKVDRIATSRIKWHKDRVEITADQALARSTIGSKSTQARPVDELLKGLLADGNRSVRDIFQRGKLSTFTEKQLRAAADRLGVVKTNTGFGKTKQWFWKLPLPLAKAS